MHALKSLRHLWLVPFEAAVRGVPRAGGELVVGRRRSVPLSIVRMLDGKRHHLKAHDEVAVCAYK
jgi:hypothetical protein